jgi:hypothetical protein
MDTWIQEYRTTVYLVYNSYSFYYGLLAKWLHKQTSTKNHGFANLQTVVSYAYKQRHYYAIEIFNICVFCFHYCLLNHATCAWQVYKFYESNKHYELSEILKNIFSRDLGGKQVKCHSSQNPAYPGSFVCTTGICHAIYKKATTIQTNNNRFRISLLFSQNAKSIPFLYRYYSALCLPNNRQYSLLLFSYFSSKLLFWA